MSVFTGALSAKYQLELSVAESSVNVPGNSSQVPASLVIRKLSGSGYYQSGTSYWSVNIDGQTFSGSIPGYDFSAYTTLTLWSGTLTIVHGADGKKTISATAAFSEYSSNIGSGSASGSLKLTDIPRASTPTFELAGTPVTAADAGAALTIKTNRASTAFTHTLKYVVNDTAAAATLDESWGDAGWTSRGWYNFSTPGPSGFTLKDGWRHLLADPIYGPTENSLSTTVTPDITLVPTHDLTKGLYVVSIGSMLVNNGDGTMAACLRLYNGSVLVLEVRAYGDGTAKVNGTTRVLNLASSGATIDLVSAYAGTISDGTHSYPITPTGGGTFEVDKVALTQIGSTDATPFFGRIIATPKSTGTIATGVTVSQAWTIPVDLLYQIPNAQQGLVSIVCETYNGTTLVGTTTTPLTMKVPASSTYDPTFGTVTRADSVTEVATVMGAGTFVQGLSKLALAITAAAGAYGSTIVSSKIEIVGQTPISATGATGAAGTMSEPLASSGTVAVVGTVTDSRGRTGSKTVNVTVLPYSVPHLDHAVLRRALSGGTLDENGTYIRADMYATATSLVVGGVEKNAVVIKLSSRMRGNTTWTPKTTVAPAALFYNGHTEIGTYLLNLSYDVLVEVSDAFGALTSSVAVGNVATAGVLVHLGQLGQGVGFGKYWELGRGSIDALGAIFQNNGEPVQSAIYATDAVMGPVKLSTHAQAAAMADDQRAVTPSGLAFLALAARNRNCLINGTFRTNQRAVASGTSLPPESFIHDRWVIAGRVNRLLNPTGADTTSAATMYRTWTTGPTSAGTIQGLAATIPGVAHQGRVIRNTMGAGETSGLLLSGSTNGSATLVTGNLPRIESGKVQTFAIWLRASVNRQFRIDVVQRDEAGNQIGSTFSGPVVNLVANTWQRYIVTYVGEAVATRVQFYGAAVGGNWSASQTLDFGAAMVVAGSAPGDYFDGASTGGVWSGTTNYSASYDRAAASITWSTDPHGQPITLPSGAGVLQIVERANVPAGTWVLSWDGTARGRVYNRSNATPPAFASGPIVVTLDGLDDVVVEFQAVGGSATLGETQLEVGEFATPFELVPVQQELALCQRYFWRVANNGTSNVMWSVFSAYTQSIYYGYTQFPVRMKNTPTGRNSGVTGQFQLFYASVNTTSTNCRFAQGSPDGIRCEYTSAGTVSVGYSGWAELRPGFYIEFDAEF